MLISVLIPTYKRLTLLKRAVDEVLRQTYKNWELIISDDEATEGETWLWLEDLVERDRRVRIVKNRSGKHGQVFNVNNGLRECKGEWIKILFDDDRIMPDCLAKMANVARMVPTAAMIGCRAQKWRNGFYKGDEKDYAHADVDVIKSIDCSKAILYFDKWNGRTPTHMLVRGSVIKDFGVYMPENVAYKLPVDWVWFAAILMHGDYAMMRDVLVCQCEGEVASLTGGVRQNPYSLDKELFPAYSDIYEQITTSTEEFRETWPCIYAEINGIRGIYHLSRGRVIRGFIMLLKMLCSGKGTILTSRWLLQGIFPSHFAATKRYAFS
jgi:glycosyltransferase involved in cell wall biosynthesis